MQPAAVVAFEGHTNMATVPLCTKGGALALGLLGEIYEICETCGLKHCPGEPMEVDISDLTWDQFIYPRGGKSEKTINAYVEALEIGAQFPPIKIQRVFNYADGNDTTEAIIILDGVILISLWINVYQILKQYQNQTPLKMPNICSHSMLQMATF